MEKKKTRILSMFLALALLFGVIGAAAVPASASSSRWKGSDFSRGALAERINTIINDGISDNLSSLPKLGGTFSSSKSFSIRFANRTWRGSQCMAYAYAAYSALFDNRDPAPAQNEVFSSLQGRSSLNYDTLKDLGVRCGAYVRTTANKDGSYHSSKGHSFLILFRILHIIFFLRSDHIANNTSLNSSPGNPICTTKLRHQLCLTVSNRP